jgi:ABC-2 type transport system permease protein
VRRIYPVIYDLKRSFIRKAVLLTLIVFILLGIGISYVIYVGFIKSNIDLSSKTTLLATLWISHNGKIAVSGYIIGPQGNGVSNALVKLYINNTVVSNRTGNNGFFTIYTNYSAGNISETGILSLIHMLKSGKLHVKTPYDEYDVSLKPYQAPESPVSGEGLQKRLRAEKLSSSPAIVFLRISPYVYEPLENAFVNPSPLVIIKYYSGNNTYKVLSATPFLYVSGMKYNVTYKYIGSLYIAYAMRGNATTYCKSGSLLGVFDKPVNTYMLRAGENTTLVLCYGIGDTCKCISSAHQKSPLITEAYVMQLMSQTTTISYLIPIITLYIGYVLMAKPRSTGALEFVLARPITRLDIYITRYMAGVLANILYAVVIVLTLLITSNILIGLPIDWFSALILITGLIASLTALYSLYYAIGSTLRSGAYLGVTITLYLIFSIFWQTIISIYGFSTGILFKNYEEYLNLVRTSYYFNPLGSYYLLTEYIRHMYGLISYSPSIPLITLSAIIWIIVPVVLGYLRFRRINLSS